MVCPFLAVSPPSDAADLYRGDGLQQLGGVRAVRGGGRRQHLPLHQVAQAHLGDRGVKNKGLAICTNIVLTKYLNGHIGGLMEMQKQNTEEREI